ncbi:MAG TPA: hypothetical protein DCP31_10985 [Cyanobacteria bacterium UBA8543]|nr:hypothetical protein [Cyanobacteria bacterium UBA8543]
MLPKQVEVLVHDNFGGQVEDRYTVVVSSTAANLPPAIAISVNFPLESVHQQLPKKDVVQLQLLVYLMRLQSAVL